jgi:uncharacterized phage protein (TIGR02218 family)
VTEGRLWTLGTEALRDAPGSGSDGRLWTLGLEVLRDAVPVFGARTTQAAVQIAYAGGGVPRVTQAAVSALYDESAAPARVTQAAANVLFDQIASGRVTQVAVSALILDSLDGGEVNTTCLLFRIRRADGVVQRFASLDRDVVWAGETWLGTAPLDPMAAEAARGLAAGQTEVVGLLDAVTLRAEDLLNGLYDDAEMRVIRIDWSAPARGGIVLFEGRLAVAQIGETQFSAEIRLPGARLEQAVVELYSPECRVDLYSPPCGVAPGPWTETHTVTAVLSHTRIEVAGFTRPAGWADYGMITVLAGPNANARREIRRHHAGGVLDLWEPFAAPLTAGTSVSIAAGCDKRRTTCAGKFGNVLNFRGFPDVPGEDRLFRTPDAR